MPFPDTPPAPPTAFVAPAEVRLTEEDIRVADHTHMGMLGLYYLRPLSPNWLGGIAVFGATNGDHGGFFGWGISAAYQLRNGPWRAEAGLFAGGGGGSPGWVGGGLMLRPHVALTRTWGNVSVGVGASQLWMPSGLVHSTQPFVTIAWASDVLLGPPGGDAPPADEGLAVSAMPTETGVTVGRYLMRAQPVPSSGNAAAAELRYGGLVFRRALTGSLYGAQPYWLMSTAGSLTQAYTGYAELMGGIGAKYPLPFVPAISLRIEGAIGSGGAGSALDTGGGLLRKVSAGVSWRIGPQLTLAANAGRIASRGAFDASEVQLELGLRGWDVVPGETRTIGPTPATLSWTPWSLSTGMNLYARAAREGGGQPGLGTTVLKIERAIDRNWRLVGQASIGVSGNAGGFATGQFGLGWLTAPLANAAWQFGAEATVGAAGGGMVRVGGGVIGQAQMQARYALSPEWALQVDTGWLRSKQGTLASPFVGLSAVYSFSRLQGKS